MLDEVGFPRVGLELTVRPLHKSHVHTPLLDPRDMPPCVADAGSWNDQQCGDETRIRGHHISPWLGIQQTADANRCHLSYFLIKGIIHVLRPPVNAKSNQTACPPNAIPKTTTAFRRKPGQHYKTSSILMSSSSSSSERASGLTTAASSAGLGSEATMPWYSDLSDQ